MNVSVVLAQQPELFRSPPPSSSSSSSRAAFNAVCTCRARAADPTRDGCPPPRQGLRPLPPLIDVRAANGRTRRPTSNILHGILSMGQNSHDNNNNNISSNMGFSSNNNSSSSTYTVTESYSFARARPAGHGEEHHLPQQVAAQARYPTPPSSPEASTWSSDGGAPCAAARVLPVAAAGSGGGGFLGVPPSSSAASIDNIHSSSAYSSAAANNVHSPSTCSSSSTSLALSPPAPLAVFPKEETVDDVESWTIGGEFRKYHESDWRYGEGNNTVAVTAAAAAAAADDDDSALLQPINLRKRTQSPTDDELPQDVPIDLSCPKKIQRMGKPSPLCRRLYKPYDGTSDELLSGSSSSSSSSTQPLLEDESGAADDDDSILKSILCGRLQSGAAHPQLGVLAPAVAPSSPSRFSDLLLPSIPGDRQVRDSFLPLPTTAGSLSSSQGLTRSPDERVAALIARARKRMSASSLTVEPDTLLSSSSASPSSSSSSSSSASPPLTARRTDNIVCLAKKNLLPVSARMSDWLLKLIRFAKGVREFTLLSHDDQVALVLSSWSRMLLLSMAEDNFEFAVTSCGPPSPTPTPPLSCDGGSPRGGNGYGLCSPPTSPTPATAAAAAAAAAPVLPTMRSVEMIQSFIRKCQTLAIDKDEMNFLRLLSLFHPSHTGVEDIATIETINAKVRKSLKDHSERTNPTGGAGSRRYSQLLLCLPQVFGLEPTVMEALFCKQITANTDMELLLKEMLNRL